MKGSQKIGQDIGIRTPPTKNFLVIVDEGLNGNQLGWSEEVGKCSRCGNYPNLKK
jgi:hypothetical protein